LKFILPTNPTLLNDRGRYIVALGRDILYEWARCWTERDLYGLAALFPADGIYEDMALPHRSEGATELNDFFVMTFNAFPDFRVEVHGAIGDDRMAAGEWTMSGTHMGDAPGQPATGKPFVVPGTSFLRLRNGLIAHHRDYWNLLTMNRQLGLA
jgi:steroid delta-isomerase-like uncharacterized protein